MNIIGIDVATMDARIGLVLASRAGDRTQVLAAVLCSKERSAAATVIGWAHDVPRALLAIDAPLGWPAAMRALATHRAGQALPAPPNEMFRRATDGHVHRMVGKLPLDVGADRIARTAHAALCLLGRLRHDLGLEVPLAWMPEFAGIAAIEVYPGATLKARGIRCSGYKRPEQVDERAEILRALTRDIDVGTFGPLLQREPDVLDALACVSAGVDFLEGQSMAPEHRGLAEQEGWIWVRRP